MGLGDIVKKAKAEQPEQPPATKGKKTKPTTPQTDIMAEILTPPPAPERTIRFTADLPESLHKRLTMAAARAGKKKVDIVRELLEATLPNA